MSALPAGAVKYNYYNLGDISGGYGYLKINDHGWVVGMDSGLHAILWTPEAGLRDLGTLGGEQSAATAINSKNQVVGYAFDINGKQRAFLWTSTNGMQDLGSLPDSGNTVALAINDYGQAAGFSWSPVDGWTHAVMWNSPNNITDLGAGGYLRLANGINDFCEVVGYTRPNGSFDMQPFKWTSQSGLQSLPTLGGNIGEARSVNNNGQIVGWSTTSEGLTLAVLWDPKGGIQSLGILVVGYGSDATDINNSSQIVGSSDMRAFIWNQSDGMQDLNNLTVNLPKGVVLSNAHSINNLGQIVGITSGGDSFLLTPQVEVAKQVYGVCIGSRKHEIKPQPWPFPPNEVDLRADWGAALMAEKLGKLAKNDKNIKIFIGDFDTGGIKKSDIKNYLDGLIVNPDDLLVFYVHGHGNQTDSKEYYYVEIGPDILSPDSEGFLSDADLLTYLQAKDCNKWVLIDACHSGGFQTKLSGLNKLGLLTATGLYGPSIPWFIQYGWFTQGLVGALSITNGKITADCADPIGKLSFGELACYVTDLWPLTQEFQDAIGTTMYELEFGDPGVFTADKYNPGAISTNDLKGIGLSANLIPAINLLLLD